MASATAISETESGPAGAAKTSLMPMLVVMLLTVVLTVGGVAGALVYLAKSGRLGGLSAAAAAPKVEPVKPAVHPVVLEPMLVNLADADGHSYLRAGVTLMVEDPAKGDKGGEGKEGKPVAGANAAARDTILDVLGRQQAAELLAPEGKERLKAVLKTALAARVLEDKVAEIYFTEFQVQR